MSLITDIIEIRLKFLISIIIFYLIIFIPKSGAELSNDFKGDNSIRYPIDLVSCFSPGLLSIKTNTENDFIPPVVPGRPEFYFSTFNNTYIIFWHSSLDLESGIVCYELQEKDNISMTWKKVNDNILISLTGYSIIDKIAGRYFYRVWAKNAVGLWSRWSLVSQQVNVSLPDKIITRVSNFPNPVNLRKENTTITYFLNRDVDVAITIYDLMGYKIRTWHFSAGKKGGSQGINNIVWDCMDDKGNKIFKGCYICRIKAGFNQKVTIATRKIGVIY